MKEEDKQLQVERGELVKHDADGAVYQRIFKALGNEPSFHLPTNFASAMVQRIIHEKQQKELRKDYLWLGLGIFSFAIAFIVLLLLTSFTLDSGVFKFISSYGGLLLFGAVFVFALHWIDRRLLHTKNTFR